MTIYFNVQINCRHKNSILTKILKKTNLNEEKSDILRVEIIKAVGCERFMSFRLKDYEMRKVETNGLN